jgi:3-amino-5-hydroxybenzoic acid synthesis related protein
MMRSKSRQPMVLRGIIFDLDGVLVNSFEVMRRAFALAYREIVGAGDPPFGEYRQHMGRYFPDIMRDMGLPAEMEGPFVRESQRLASQVEVYDGVPGMLVELRERNLRLAVATGKSGPRARSLLSTLGLLDLFDAVIGSDEVAHPKPAADIVLAALDRLGIGPAEAIMVGDAPADMLSAHSAGVFAVAAFWGEADSAELLAAAPAATLQRPADILALTPPGVPSET